MFPILKDIFETIFVPYVKPPIDLRYHTADGEKKSIYLHGYGWLVTEDYVRIKAELNQRAKDRYNESRRRESVSTATTIVVNNVTINNGNFIQGKIS